MGIAQLNPESSITQNTLPNVNTEPPKSIFTELVPESKIVSLLKYAEGYPWTVHYYGQILSASNTVELADPTTPNLANPRYEIIDLNIQVQNPLTSNYDSSTGVTTITGSSLTPYGVKPNIGDIFIAKVDSGEDAVFVVTNVTRKTYRKDTLYEIDYVLFDYTSVTNFYSRVKSSVQQTYYYNKNYTSNKDLLINPDVKEATDRLKNYNYYSIESYLKSYLYKELNTILLPGIDYTLYDPYLVGFLYKTLDTSKLLKPLMHIPSVHTSTQENILSIFDVILNRNKYQLNSISKRAKFVSTAELLNVYRYSSLALTGYDYSCYIYDQDDNLEIENLTRPKILFNSTNTINPKTAKNYSTSTITVDTVNNNNVYTKNLLHELFVDEYYVVSENFYLYHQNHALNYNNISYLELLIYKFISREAIAKQDLVVAIETYQSWSHLHKFYLLPILWTISKV